MLIPELPKDREHLVLDNINLVHHVLHKKLKVLKTHPSYEDYFQEGCMGLILAAVRFDESKGCTFATFAIPNIVGYILHYRRNCESVISMPRRLQDKVVQVLKCESQGCSLNEIEQATGIKPVDLAEIRNLCNVQSIHQPVFIGKDGDVATIEDMVASPSDWTEELLSEEHIVSTIQRISATIHNKTHRDVWEEYIYSLFYGEKLKHKYFVEKYNLKQPTVCRILRKYSQKFAKLLQEDM